MKKVKTVRFLSAMFLVVTIIASLCVPAQAAEVTYREEPISEVCFACHNNDLHRKVAMAKDVENIKEAMMLITIREKLEALKAKEELKMATEHHEFKNKIEAVKETVDKMAESSDENIDWNTMTFGYGHGWCFSKKYAEGAEDGGDININDNGAIQAVVREDGGDIVLD